jgi:hypothetical protein
MLTDILSIIHGYPGMMCGFRTSSSEEPWEKSAVPLFRSNDIISISTAKGIRIFPLRKERPWFVGILV